MNNNTTPPGNIAGLFPYGFQMTLVIASGTVTAEDTFTFPKENLLVRHIGVSVYDNNGSILVAEQNRDLFLFNMLDAASQQQFFNQAIDIFHLDQLARATQFAQFIIPGKTQYTASLTISANINSGTPLATRPVRAHVLFMGHKILQ